MNKQLKAPAAVDSGRPSPVATFISVIERFAEANPRSLEGATLRVIEGHPSKSLRFVPRVMGACFEQLGVSSGTDEPLKLALRGVHTYRIVKNNTTNLDPLNGLSLMLVDFLRNSGELVHHRINEGCEDGEWYYLSRTSPSRDFTISAESAKSQDDSDRGKHKLRLDIAIFSRDELG